jgi:hypothetical protein
MKEKSFITPFPDHFGGQGHDGRRPDGFRCREWGEKKSRQTLGQQNELVEMS